MAVRRWIVIADHVPVVGNGSRAAIISDRRITGLLRSPRTAIRADRRGPTPAVPLDRTSPQSDPRLGRTTPAIDQGLRYGPRPPRDLQESTQTFDHLAVAALIRRRSTLRRQPGPSPPEPPPPRASHCIAGFLDTIRPALYHIGATARPGSAATSAPQSAAVMSWPSPSVVSAWHVACRLQEQRPVGSSVSRCRYAGPGSLP